MLGPNGRHLHGECFWKQRSKESGEAFLGGDIRRVSAEQEGKLGSYETWSIWIRVSGLVSVQSD